jgi:salicylate hydroxylase
MYRDVLSTEPPKIPADSFHADLGARDAEVAAHAAFRKRHYDHDGGPEAETAAAALS